MLMVADHAGKKYWRGDIMISFGIMQGRLTPPNGREIQFFPFDTWKEEFRIGQKLGLDEIEWIFDYEGYKKNPLWFDEGIKEIKTIIYQTSIQIKAVCFDYFMRRPFFKYDGKQQDFVRDENFRFLKHTMMAMKEIGASLLEIPLIDNSSVQKTEEETVIEFVKEVLKVASQVGIKIGLETDMEPGRFKEFLDKMESENLYANYDSGNSSGLGYDHELEIYSLKSYIANVHIKDRKLHGTTVALGTGDADFDKVFSSLSGINYDGSIILQAARGEDGEEEANIRQQLDFVKKYCRIYGLAKL